jgi:hypothetical protein
MGTVGGTIAMGVIGRQLRAARSNSAFGSLI